MTRYALYNSDTCAMVTTETFASQEEALGFDGLPIHEFAIYVVPVDDPMSVEGPDGSLLEADDSNPPELTKWRVVITKKESSMLELEFTAPDGEAPTWADVFPEAGTDPDLELRQDTVRVGDDVHDGCGIVDEYDWAYIGVELGDRIVTKLERIEEES